MKSIGVLGTLFFVLLAVVYAGTGYGIGWIIDITFNVDVNYSFFIIGGLIIYLLCVLPFVIIGLLAKKSIDEIEGEIK